MIIMDKYSESIVSFEEGELLHGHPMKAGFYFWDETGDAEGPYVSFADAKQALSNYEP